MDVQTTITGLLLKKTYNHRNLGPPVQREGRQSTNGVGWVTCLTSGTPIFLQASRKFSTFLRHLAMLSLGWKHKDTFTQQDYFSENKQNTFHQDYEVLVEIRNKILDIYLSSRRSGLTVWDVPLQARARGCCQQSVAECDWPDGRARRRPSERTRGLQEGRPSVCSRCSEEKTTV